MLSYNISLQRQSWNHRKFLHFPDLWVMVYVLDCKIACTGKKKSLTRIKCMQMIGYPTHKTFWEMFVDCFAIYENFNNMLNVQIFYGLKHRYMFVYFSFWRNGLPHHSSNVYSIYAFYIIVFLLVMSNYDLLQPSQFA